ncbi:alpha/beta hydrolase [Streptomyces coffeae]|uniref:Prolyl oligopeptidase family serine peptidase n=1 Tax=Streptomyces coffeae TaxID=621382 RepID=A0ABS1NAZ1_9ACTN|nr:alpha/beta fold hydrolase [Streptomyces coffeae]MBL1097242.1 prolyl oligopeptidase family serine peptidase [Streptomyces coffeae]
MRLRTAAAAAASTLLSAGVAAVAAGRYATDAALRPAPVRPLPDEPPLTVHATEPGRITLTRSLASLRPGTYGLAGPACHAVIGPVLEEAPSPADCVVRHLERITHGTLGPGDKVRLTPQVHIGNPRDTLGIDHADVDVPGELGPLPAWFVPGEHATWVITVHGLGTTREHPMVVMPFLRKLRVPVLDLAYRGDPGAPPPEDGIGHLGDTEWRDLDAAIRYAVRYGAHRVVLHGWSTGGAMALHAAVNSALRHRVNGIVLDSPVLDWQATLRALAVARGTPAALMPLVIRAAEGRTGLHGSRFTEAADPGRLTVPVLIVHGPDDTLAPWSVSRELAERRSELVTLHPVADAPHGAMWNADPRGYEEALRRFLTPLL